MIDINQLKKEMSRRGYRPVLNKEGKEPALTRLNSTEFLYIATERLVEELTKIGKVIDPVTLAITDKPPKVAVPTPPPTAPPTAPALPPAKPAKASELWTEAELRKLAYKELRKLAALWDDVNGNKGTEHMVSTLTGKPKKPPQ